MHSHSDESESHKLTFALTNARGLPTETTEALVLSRQLTSVKKRWKLHLDIGAGTDKKQDNRKQSLETKQCRLQ